MWQISTVVVGGLRVNNWSIERMVEVEMFLGLAKAWNVVVVGLVVFGVTG